MVKNYEAKTHNYSTFIASKSIHQFYLQSQIVSNKIYENSKYLMILLKKPRIIRFTIL